MSQTIKIIVAIAITAVVVGGSVYFWQQPSIPTGSQNNQTVLETEENENSSNKQESIKRSEIDNEDNLLTLPNDVEWITYSDDDVSFIYPKTFLGTSLQEDFDQNLSREQWEIEREGNKIFIRPNFQSGNPMASTYGISILKDTWEADEAWGYAAKENQGPESQWGEKLDLQLDGYYIGVLRNLDFGIMSGVEDVYALIPGGIDGRGISQKPTDKHFLIYAGSGLYQEYIENILIPSIKAK